MRTPKDFVGGQRWTSRLRLRLRSLVRRGRVEDELDDELRYHVDRLIEDNLAAGMPADEARRAALREMGAIEVQKEECRDARGLVLVDSILQDIRYALRTLMHAPVFAVGAILSLAFGIGANAAIFSLWYGVLHAALPGVDRPNQLVMLTNPSASGAWTGMWNGRTDGPRPWLTYEEFEELRSHPEIFSTLMASQSSLMTWQIRVAGDAPEPVRGRMVSGEYFNVLGVTPIIGRGFGRAYDSDALPHVVLSHSYWQRRFGGRTDVLGKTFTLRNATLTVVGVTPPGFVGETMGQQPDFWLPLRMQLQVMPGRDRLHDAPPAKSMWLQVFGRLNPAVTMAQAEAQANSIFRAGMQTFYGAMPADRLADALTQRIQIQSAAQGASPARKEFSRSLTALLAAVGVLLLIACANLANLLLARGAARRTELALRMSLGASRARVVRQLITESLTLAVAGALAAVAVAYLLHATLVWMITQADERFAMTFTLDPLVLAFITATTVIAVLVFGAVPAWQVTRDTAVTALKDHNRALGSTGQLRSGRLLVALQLALTLPLLVGAGLMARTLSNLQRTDLGFPAERLLLVRVDLRDATTEAGRIEGLLRELPERIRAIPGVRAVSFSHLGLFSGGTSISSVEVEGYEPKGEFDRQSIVDVVGSNYFSTLGVPMRLGREIDDRDRGHASDVCVVNEAFVKVFFERRNPIGMGVTTREDDGVGKRYQIVGVAGDSRADDVRGPILPRFYLPHKEVAEGGTSGTSPTFFIRIATDPSPVLASVRSVIRGVDERISIMLASSVGEQVAPLIAQDRTTAQLAEVFAFVAMTLAIVGLYGVLSYSVARRTGEIAVRIAVGAASHRVIGMILGETSRVVAVGVIVGGGLAYVGSRLLRERLYGVEPNDPFILGLATSALLLVALGAAYIPARRASRVDPMTALRQQ